ncbi:hypothetical protein PENTCL1PPCAC_17539 [Pristionchus entomophagus]|uniref:Uncharacterized protein n=1 Tax=Pristionchus entomophagus TaxID=358040 RepID=A0AAV5TMU0_9BILA|nr:hypothetical protein PENTCL1PPCAC_17539 [Pristionchus entomophagus]
MLPTWGMAMPLPSSLNRKDSGVVPLVSEEEALEATLMVVANSAIPTMEMISEDLEEDSGETRILEDSAVRIDSLHDLVLPSVGVSGIREREYSWIDSIMDLFDGPSSRSHPLPRISSPSPLPRISSSLPSPPSPSSSLPISSIGSGGFYKGGGNSFVN